MSRQYIPDIVFLDIDGVLNSSRFQSEPTNTRHEIRGCTGVDPEAVAHLGRVLIDADIDGVVLTSTWREDGDLSCWAERLARLGMTVPVVGRTPKIDGFDGWVGDVQIRIESDRQRRGLEIAWWIDQHVGACSHVILDDDDRLGWMKPWLVRIDPEVGVIGQHHDELLGAIRQKLKMTCEVGKQMDPVELDRIRNCWVSSGQPSIGRQWNKIGQWGRWSTSYSLVEPIDWDPSEGRGRT